MLVSDLFLQVPIAYRNVVFVAGLFMLAWCLYRLLVMLINWVGGWFRY